MTANLKSRLVYGHGILLSKYHFGLICMAGTDKTTFEKLETSYNKCFRAIYGRGEGLLTNTEIQTTLKITLLLLLFIKNKKKYREKTKFIT